MPPFEPVSPPNAPTPVAEIQRSARLLADGESAEALLRLEALSAAVPAYATSQVLLAKAYEAEQRWEDALEAWHRAHFLAPGSPLIQRERRRLLEAKARAAEAASPPEVPSEPPADRGAEEVDGEVAGEPGEQEELAEDEMVEEDVAENEVAEDEMVEPAEEQVEEQAETMPDEALLDQEQPNEALHEVAEPSDSEALPEALTEELPEALREDGPEEALPEAIPPEAIPEVFVDESAPVSDALGIEIAGSITHTPDGEAARWKPSGDSPSEAEAEGADTGWAVVSETETERAEETVIEAQIAAPMDEAAAQDRAETKDVADMQAVGTDAAQADDLDSLIRELEDAPRIRPDPNFVGEDENEGFDDEIADDMVSETLARIYVAQGQFGEAAGVYEKLAGQNPNQAEEFSEKAAELRARVDGAG